MKLYIGIDGGGTHTTACLADETGKVLSRAEGGSGNPNHVCDAELVVTFSQLLVDLLKQANAGVNDIAAAFAGVAGVTCKETAGRIHTVLATAGLIKATIGVDHDIRIALAGGLAGRPGIALIVGTGSSCYGRNAAGQTWQTGGWGSLISDEGSGFYIGREAMTAAVRMADGRQAASPLLQAVFDWLHITDVSQVLNRVYEKELSRADIAAFAPTIISLAEADDAAAVQIIEKSARQLAVMVAANHAAMPTSNDPEIVITGGVGTANTVYRALIDAAINSELPRARIVAPELDPAAGAALLAMELHSGQLPQQAVANLKGST